MTEFDENIKEKILNAKAISFDMFDTLVHRDFLYAEDVFTEVEILSFVKHFRLNRKNAERKASKKFSHTSLKQIYSFLPYDESVKEKLFNLEIQNEIKNCVADKYARSIFDFCIRNKKPVYIISDMYLDSITEKKILEKCGYGSDLKIFVSCENGFAKADGGKLFSCFLTETGYSASEILHFGDNYNVDFIGAKSAGIECILIKQKEYDGYYSNFNFGKLKRLLANNTFYVPSKKDIEKSRLTAFIKNRIKNLESEAERVGYEVFGPVAYCFVKNIHEYCIRNGFNKIFFCARDTKYLLEIYNLLYESAALPSEYFRISRRAVKKIKAYLEGDTSNEIQDNAKGLKKYLNYTGASNNKVAYVDLGWSGSMIKVYEEFCNKENIPLDYKIFFIGTEKIKTSPNFSEKLAFQLLGNSFNSVKTHILSSLTETCFSEFGGTCLGYSSTETGSPILGESEVFISELDEIHKGMIQFAKDIHKQNIVFELNDFVKEILYTFSQNPRITDIEYLKDIKRNDDKFLTLHSNREYFKKPLLIFKDIDKSTWKGALFKSVFPKTSVLLVSIYLFMNKIRLILKRGL